MNINRQQVQYSAATLCVVLLTVLLDAVYFSKSNELEPIGKNQVPALETPVKPQNELMPQTKDVVKHVVKQIALVKMVLPEPVMQSIDAQPAKLNKSPASIQTNDKSVTASPMVAPLAAPLAALSAPESSRERVKSKAAFVVASPKLDQTAQLPLGPSPSPAQISNHLEQLASLSSNVRSLTFPNAFTVQILEYMHSCVGIDVGAIDNNKVTVFSHKNSRHSEIVRVASGYTTPQEQSLLAIYAPGKTLVRLYPIAFDQGLGALISTTLGAQPLNQFSGEYRLGDNSLWLTNITINQEVVKQDWQLKHGC